MLIMAEYEICTDFLEIVAGTNNRFAFTYTEAAKNVSENNSKSMNYIKNFITSIEQLASKDTVKDSRISSSKGNIEDFSGYDNIKTSMEFLKKNLSGIPIMKDLTSLYDALVSCKSSYMDGYRKNVRLVVLEYESTVYMLVTGLSMAMMNYVDVVQNGTSIRIQKKSPGKTYGVIDKTIRDLSNELSKRSHKEYLENIIKAKDDVGVNVNIEESTTFMESSISDTIDLIDSIFSKVGKLGKFARNVIVSIKNSVFGIVPLIRSVLYLKYKRKADMILSLDQQVQFIQRNIEQLQNMKNMDPAKKEEIIKKQKAYIEAYKKKAEKLRAQLCETEKEAAIAIKQEDPKMKDTDDDLVLEDGRKIIDIFTNTDEYMESYKDKYQEAEMPKSIKERYNAYDQIEKEYDVKIPSSVKLAYALTKASVMYRFGNNDIEVDILSPNQMKSESKSINDSIKDKESKKYTPVVAIAAIGNGDFDVIDKGGKIKYYSHDGKTSIKNNKDNVPTDPEKFFFVDHPNARYDKVKNKTIYINPDVGNNSPLN